MDRLKTIFRYFAGFILFCLIINGLTYLATRPEYRNLNSYTLEVYSPSVKITEAKNKYSGGYIEGTVTNNTGKLIDLKYLKFEFYDKDETYLGTEFKELKYFNVGEVEKFRIEHKHRQVDNVIISMEDEPVAMPGNKIEEAIQTWWPAAFMIVKVFVLL